MNSPPPLSSLIRSMFYRMSSTIISVPNKTAGVMPSSCKTGSSYAPSARGPPLS
jgi:hypothetical protein